jgi:GNAT superfamily N-acetyltransferase
MSRHAGSTSTVTVRPVTSERLADLEAFSRSHGTFRYCSCQRWRMTSTEFRTSGKEDRVARLEQAVADGTPVGVLGYRDDVPVGWCSIAPRETYLSLERSRVLPRVDDLAVWSVVCLYVVGEARGSGVAAALLEGAVDYARASGAVAVEGYPVTPDMKSYTHMGPLAVFERAGFEDVTPPGRTRKVMRRRCAGDTASSTSSQPSS